MLEHTGGHQGSDRVVTLGRRGFIASHLLRELERRACPVLALGRDAVDLTEAASVDKLSGLLRSTDIVVVDAALPPERGRDFRAFSQNLRMVEHLCEVFDKNPPAHVIYLSSDAVYDASKIPLDEDSTREPINLYALMHTAREMLLDSVLETRGVPLCILRPVNIFGHGDPHGSYGPNAFVNQAIAERRITLYGRGEERRCHLYIGDAVRLIALCIEKRSRGSINLAQPGVTSFMELAQHVQKQCPFEVRFEFRPRTVPTIHRPYKITQVFRFIQNRGRPIGPIVHRPFDSRQLVRSFPEFEFTPLDTALEAFIRTAIDAASTHA
ncbi:MAG: SDR family oxidoreductase [bacterium]|nr:SDR family oxidoreductase [bacterium]